MYRINASHIKGSTFNLGELKKLARGMSEKLRTEGEFRRRHGSENDVADRRNK